MNPRTALTRRLLLAGAATLLATGRPALAQSTPPLLRVGVEGNYPPFSKMGPDGRLSGFDIDIALALCEAMNVRCQLVQQEWDGMMPALRARKFDMIVASMTITEDRRKAADFSDPYYDVPSRFVARAGAFRDASPEALKGRRIIVLRNTPRAQYLQQRYPGSELLQVNKETDVYLELAAGRGDIAFGSTVVSGEAFLKTPQGKGYAQVGPTVRLEGGTGVGVAVRKGETELVGRINAALKKIKADGTYKRLADRYFDFDISGN